MQIPLSSLKLIVAFLISTLSIHSYGNSTVTLCGNVYIDKVAEQVYTLNDNYKRPMGVFKSQPTVRCIETFPAYMEEMIELTSGLTLTIRSSNGQSKAQIYDAAGVSQELGSCVQTSAPRLDSNKIGLE